ncbi:MAG: DUF1254 domain-containing protein [Lachnospiraceae bacterium]|nr:DUF1254 domain-containing protein [Lachnospiraceae bacterium]
MVFRPNQELYQTILDAYFFAYPFVQSVLYAQNRTNVIKANDELGKSPYNQFSHAREYWHAKNNLHGGINMDVLYSIMTLDLGEDALFYHKPQTDRFYTLQIADAYGNPVAVIGSGGLGNEEEQNYLLAGPDFSGEAPARTTIIPIPTNLASVLLRIQVKNKEDIAEVVRLQDLSIVTPLRYLHQPYTAPDGIYNPAYDYIFYGKIKTLSLEEFFSIFNQYSLLFPPTGTDRIQTEKYISYGIGPGKHFKFEQFNDTGLIKLLKKIPEQVDLIIDEMANTKTAHEQNHWVYTLNLKTDTVNYRERAYAFQWGPMPNPPEAAIYPTTFQDRDGDPISGNLKYVIHFENGNLPAVKKYGYWSISAYTRKGLYLIDNEIDRYKIGSEDDLIFHENGSLDLYIQKERPKGEKQRNWLPIDGEEVLLFFRIYLPETNVLHGEWKPPYVEKSREDLA